MNVIKYICHHRGTIANSDVDRGVGGGGGSGRGPDPLAKYWTPWKNSDQYKHVNNIFFTSCSRNVISFYVLDVLDSFVIK